MSLCFEVGSEALSSSHSLAANISVQQYNELLGLAAAPAAATILGGGWGQRISLGHSLSQKTLSKRKFLILGRGLYGNWNQTKTQPGNPKNPKN